MAKKKRSQDRIKNGKKLAKELERLYLTVPNIADYSKEAIEFDKKLRLNSIRRAREAIKRKDFEIEEHIFIHCVTGDKKRYGNWMHTHGMYLFDKPEIEIFSVPEEFLDLVAQLINNFAIYLAKGAKINDGDMADWGKFLIKFRLHEDNITQKHYINKCLEISSLAYEEKEIISPLSRAAAMVHFKHDIASETLEHIRDGSFQGTLQAPEIKETDNVRVFIQTPFDRLKVIKNDYSSEERLFQHGMIQLVNLVDAVALRKKPSKERQKFRKEMISIRRIFLEHEPNVKSLSIVIPVKGKKTVLLECLESLSQQIFVKHHPRKVEILIIQDGYIGDESSDPIGKELFQKIFSFQSGTKFRLFKLLENRGRSTARNVGIYYAHHEIVLFVDSSMILEQNFLTEQMLRHQRIPNIALLGFKENITLREYQNNRSNIIAGRVVANYCKDLKWCHVLKEDEADFVFEGRRYKVSDKIYYMSITNNFKNLTGTDTIGRRTLPTFFQTNIVSIPLRTVKELSGFEGRFDALWGFEDSYLGALLLAKGIKFVPCPSSVAFKVEHAEDKTKFFDIERHKQQFIELLRKREIAYYTGRLLEEKIKKLKEQNVVQEVEIQKSR